MNKIFTFTLGLISIFVISSCTVRTTMSTPNTSVSVRATYGVLKGVVEVHDRDNLYIVVDPKCKCRRSYKVRGRYRYKLKKYRNRNVKVEGYIKNKTPWSGEIEVIKIKEIYR